MTYRTVVAESGKPIDGAKLAEHIKELEDLEERRVEINKEFSRAYQRAGDRGFNKKTVKAVVGRRKKDRDRVVADEKEIHDYEIALGMRTMDLPLAPQSTEESLAPQADLTEAEKAEEDVEAAATAQDANGEAELTQVDAYDMGHAAKLRGAALDECQWKRSTKLGKAWTLGYNDAANEAANEAAEPDDTEPATAPASTAPPEPEEPAAEPEPLPEAVQAEEDDYRPGPAYPEGRAGYEKGLGSHACPYDAGTTEAADWIVGWNERAAEDKADQPAPPEAPGHEDKTEHMDPATYRAAVGADSL